MPLCPMSGKTIITANPSERSKRYTLGLSSGEDPRELVTAKVRNFLGFAESEGYECGWLDTACIDKTSSAELSEAINSMYLWYSDALLCCVYLSDVGEADNPFSPKSDFRSSRWHTRGWTLQELIAPRNIIFVSRSWKFIRTKTSLAAVLQDVSGVDLEVLLRQNDDWPSSISVARRMSWASRRVTTRPEDRAYSLMGIFEVSMPIIYGEGGERAFMRLQLEIIDICPDQTIFAWGPIHPDANVALPKLQWPRPRHLARISPKKDIYNRLLAPSPEEFASSANIRPIDPQIYADLFGEAVDTKYTMSRTGSMLRLPLTLDCEIGEPEFAPNIHAAALACAVDEATIVLLFLGHKREFHTFSTCSRLETLTFTSIGAHVWMPISSSGEPHRPEWKESTVYRGVILQLSCSLAQTTWRDPSQLQRRLDSSRDELSYFSIQQVRIDELFRFTARRQMLPGYKRAQHLTTLTDWTSIYMIRAFRNGVEFQIPPFVLSVLEERYGFIHTASGFPLDSRNGLILLVNPRRQNKCHPCIISFANPASGELLTVTFGVENVSAREHPYYEHPYYPGQLWIEVETSNVVCDRIISSTKFLPQGPDYDAAMKNARDYRYTHRFPPKHDHASIIFRLDDRAVHVGCHQYASTMNPLTSVSWTRLRSSGPWPVYRFVVTVDLVGFKAVTEYHRNPSPNRSPEDDSLPLVLAADALPPPSPDTHAPVGHASGNDMATMRARHLFPALASCLARSMYTANRFLRAGLRSAVEWLGQEADYTCGQSVWDAWSAGGV